MAACPSCGYDNREGAKFCSDCGSALAVHAAPAREERKVVTVLFCDLVGFTSRAERMDPEDVRALLGRYHAHLRSELERFGGTVEKFIGDAVMAVFGAPVAHEDDPERAVRAALAIREWAEEQADVQVRVAVNMGEALVDLGARPELGEAMVAGDVVNAAARIQSAAPVNGILAGEATYRATRDVVDFRKAEPVTAKGKADPVPVWEAVGARARFGTDPGQRGGAELVGRERELALLADALARVRAERSPQLVTLVGVPGIGKSRLVHELFQSIAESSEPTYWRQGRSLPYGEGITFWAVAEIVKSHAGILETDTAAGAEEKLVRALREALDERDAEWVARHLRPLVGLGGEAELGGDRRGEAFAAWRRLFEALAERRPLVLVFEDLHWADDGVLDFVDHLAEWATRVPLLVVCTARPELLDRRPSWGGGKRNSAIVWLEPLADGETARLVHALLERAVLPAEMQAELLARAGGNPLYAEEFVRMLADRRGGEELPLPETVQGVIAARLDLLPPDEKALLQDAAVVGKVFWLGAVAALSGRDRASVEEALHRLEQRDFLVRSRRSSVADETEYAFRHILVRDIAHGQVPRPRRAERHRGAAEWIAALSAERSEDRAEMLAHHWLSALELARAAGQDAAELGERARIALRDAGDRALALSAFPAAVRFYREALELWPPDDPARPRLLLGYATALWSTEEQGDVLLAEARDALLAQGDVAAAAEAEARLGHIEWLRGRGDPALQHLKRAVELVRDSPPTAGKAYVLCQAAARYSILGQTHEAVRYGQEALELATRLGRPEVQADALSSIGSARVQEGDFGGLEELGRSVELARAARSAELVRACNNLGFAYMRFGDLEQARELLEEALDAAAAFGETALAAFIRGGNVLGLQARTGRWDEALATCEQVLGDASRGTRYQDASALRVRAQIRTARGDVAGALDDAAGAVATSRKALDPQAICPSLLVQARVLLEAGRRAEAEEAVGELLEITATTGWRPSWELTGLAELLWDLERREELRRLIAGSPGTRWAEPAGLVADGDFAAAADLYARLGVPVVEADTRLRAAHVLAGEGRRAEAEEELERALAFYRSVGATAYVAVAESLLAASA